MDTLDDIPLNARTLSFRSDGYDCTLQFDEEHLHYDWQSPAYSKSSKTSLKALKPELSVQRWVSEGVRKSFVLGLYFAVAAVVVYFSDLRTHIPLLAPALLLFGVQYIYRFVRAVIPLTKTVIYTDREQFIAGIPHLQRQTSQRKAFEEALLRMVKRARGDDLRA